LETLRGRPLSRIHIVGGGCQNRLLDQLCADACRLPVSAGPVETTALGNACGQLIALGVLRSLADARALVRQSYAVEEFLPQETVPEAVWERFSHSEGEDMTRHPNVGSAYALAREAFAAIGVDTEAALAASIAFPFPALLAGDDVRGFENPQGP